MVDSLLIMIHKTINEFLMHKHMSPKQLAAKLGISESYMSMLRSGRRRPSPELARKIETLTGIPLKSLLFKTGRAA